MTKSHNVYVIELCKDVLQHPKFRRANPDYVEGKACLYVGMTGKTPDERFKQHLDGYRAANFVRRYGKCLRRKKYERYNPLSYEDAARLEVQLAKKLRAEGYAVWQN